MESKRGHVSEPEVCDECGPVLNELKLLTIQAGNSQTIPEENSKRRTELWNWLHGHRRANHLATR